MRRAGQIVGLVMIGLIAVGATAWGGGVLFFAGPGGPRARAILGMILGLAADQATNFSQRIRHVAGTLPAVRSSRYRS